MTLEPKCVCGHTRSSHIHEFGYFGHCCGQNQDENGMLTEPCKCQQFVPGRSSPTSLRILGVDPSWVTGLADVWCEQEASGTPRVIFSSFEIIDVSKRKERTAQDRISEIKHLIEKFIVATTNPPFDAIAIELPFAGVSRVKGVVDQARSFRSKDAINQGRLFQAIVDVAVPAGLYHPHYSEIHQAQAKASVVRGIGIKKAVAQEAAIRLYDFHFAKITKPHKEAAIDAFLVALGYIRLFDKKIELKRLG